MLTVIMIFLGIAVLLLFDGVLENYFPTTKEYSIQSPKIKEEKKVVLLTDLHACCVGGKKDKYLQMIQKHSLARGRYDGEKRKTNRLCNRVFKRDSFDCAGLLCAR